MVQHLHTAVIIAFPRAPQAPRAEHKLLPRDETEACEWELHAAAFGFDRVAIHEQLGGQSPEDGDFILIYRMGDRWARWGVARQGDSILLWRCANGIEIGEFPTMRQALDSLLDPALRLPEVAADVLTLEPLACCPGTRG